MDSRLSLTRHRAALSIALAVMIGVVTWGLLTTAFYLTVFLLLGTPWLACAS